MSVTTQLSAIITRVARLLLAGYVAHFNTPGIYFHESSTILSSTMDQILEGH